MLRTGTRILRSLCACGLCLVCMLRVWIFRLSEDSFCRENVDVLCMWAGGVLCLLQMWIVSGK